MLTDNKIEKNYRKLLSTNEKYGILSEEFLEKYGDKIKSDGGFDTYRYEGGGVHFTLTTTKYAVMINSVLPKIKQYGEMEIIRFSVLISLRYLDSLNDNGNFSGLIYKLLSTNCSISEDEAHILSTHFDNLNTNIPGYSLSQIIKSAVELALMQNEIPDKDIKTEE